MISFDINVKTYLSLWDMNCELAVIIIIYNNSALYNIEPNNIII